MILQAEHKHPDAPPSPRVLIQPIPVPKKQQPSHHAPFVFGQMLENAQLLLGEKGRNEIKDMMKYKEEKVMLSFGVGPVEYLQHLGGKRENDVPTLLQEIMQLQTELVVDRIQWGKVVLQDRPDKGKIKQLKSDLSHKLAEMKGHLMSLSSIERKASSDAQNLMEFRKRGYWMNTSEKGVHVKKFLGKMRRIQSEQRKKYEKSIVSREQQIKAEEQKEKAQKEQAHKKMVSKELEKQTQRRLERQKYYEEEKKKREKIEEILQKISPGKPVYILKEQEFIKKVKEPEEEERQKKIEQIKKDHHPFDQEELDEHIQRYQEYKDNLIEEHRKKYDEEKEITSKAEQQLKELYHGRFHKEISPRFYDSVKLEKVSHRQKVMEYGKSVLQNYKPIIDRHKRAEIKEHIRDLKLAEDKKKRKIVLEDGTVVIQNRPEYDPRKIGVEYLQKLKEDNEGKPRNKEDRSASMLELSEGSKVKRIDYLRDNKPNIKLKYTMGEWKKVLDDSSYNAREKYQSIMEQVNVMEEKAKQKEEQMKSYKKGDKSIELKGQMDKFYLESVAAKLVVLKDVILKQ